MEKKIFISADIEGVSGITSWAATEYGGKGYEKACRQMSLETAAPPRRDQSRLSSGRQRRA